jgi:CheY-like chemotaxis protein
LAAQNALKIPSERSHEIQNALAVAGQLDTMMDLVKQPLHSLSGVLDNMLLFMQHQRGSAGVTPLSKISLAHYWVAAWSQASALHSLEGSSNVEIALGVKCDRLDVNYHEASNATATAHTSPSMQNNTTACSAVDWEALQLLGAVDIRSHVTQSTLQQVMSNLASNALKYGTCPDSTLSLKIQFSILHGASSIEKESSEAIAAASAEVRPPSQKELAKLVAMLEPMRDTAEAHRLAYKQAVPGRENISCAAGVLLISVSDKGQGMSAEEAGTLFKPFVRLRRGNAAKGTGLGLWLMRQLLQSQGGTLEVFSAGVHQGCTFIAAVPIVQFPRPRVILRAGSAEQVHSGRLKMPVSFESGNAPNRLANATGNSVYHSLLLGMHQLSQPNMNVASAAADSSGAEDAQLCSSTPLAWAAGLDKSTSLGNDSMEVAGNVLVVDDAAPIRHMMARYLRNAGLTVHTASDGRDGLNTLQTQWRAGTPIAAVVTDMTMPVMNGDEMCRHIVRLAGASADENSGDYLPLPVLIGITGNALREDADRFRDSGVVCVLTKPVSAKVVVAEVRSRLAASSVVKAASFPDNV